MSITLEPAMLLCLGWAAWTDLRELRIPNWLTLAGVTVALGLRLLPGGPTLGDGLLGAAVGLAFGLACFALGVLGGGDAKLLAAVGAFVGLDGIVGALLVTTFTGALIALVKAWRMGRLEALFRGVVSVLQGHHRGGAKQSPDVPGSALPPLPYGVAIGLGTVLWHFVIRPLGAV